MSKKSLKQFNPERVANFEARMWRAYYRHNFLMLFFLLIGLAREFFGVDYFTAMRMGYHSALAATNFRLRKKTQSEDKAKILKELTHFYKLIFDHSLESFDYKNTAQLEMDWWFIDRYPERYTISREEALAQAMAVLFNVNPARLTEYANFRARAMILQDEAEASRKETDWGLVGDFLSKSYCSLYRSVQ